MVTRLVKRGGGNKEVRLGLVCTTVLVVAVIASIVAGSALSPGSAAAMPDAPGYVGVANEPVGKAAPPALLSALTRREPLAKIEPDLLDHVQATAGEGAVYVVVVSAGELDLGRYAEFVHQFTWPAGEHVAVARVRASDVGKIAALPTVIAVNWGDPKAIIGERVSDVRPTAGTEDPAALRRRIRAAPRWDETAVLLAQEPVELDAEGGHAALASSREGPQPDGWYDVEQGHAAREAWGLGYTGEGVTVAVLDYAVDFAHQDLQGTWQVLPPGHPYAGWPQVFDPGATYLHTIDGDLPEEARTMRNAYGGMIELYQRSAVEEREVGGELRQTACFRPLQGLSSGELRVLGPEECDFVVPASQSGEVRYGHHPDTVLYGLGADPAEGIAGEWAGVLLVDSQVAGVYDTLYVDLNADHDFTDEKPATQADPLTWRDIDGDAIADLTGGLLYWVSDGESPFPGSWLWGLDDVPEPGVVVGLFGPWQAGTFDSHGTLCASNVVSQGRLGVPADVSLEFRDLPGDGRPEATNLGLAPDAKLVSIDGMSGGSFAVIDAAWRYIMFGHSMDRDDDQIQVASNSYGFSTIDNDGWDSTSRLLDYYVRQFSPSTAMLYSTGNGGPGYGTLAPPSPATGIGIAASTQMGSTGVDSITETLQITFGDVIPFSNRGPGADGKTGPHVAADGGYGAGAQPINGVTSTGSDGAHANTWWGGTSRAGPVANGGLALTYDAFHDRLGRWPTWEEARAVFMAGARYSGYDTYVAGAGVLDAADSARIAGGDHGLYALPSEWTAGDYRGGRYEAFAKLLAPGMSDSTTITLHNTSGAETDVSISGEVLRRVGSYTQTLTTDLAEESPASHVMDYLVPIDEESIPEGTELMVVRGIFAMDQFDPDGDSDPENMFYLGVMQHTDVNGNGKLWDDRNGNGVVNHRVLMDSYVAVAWDDQVKELDSMQSAIGPSLGPQGLEAELAWYGRGCNDDEREQDVREKIALIARGECTFAEKILNAQSDGAVGVVTFSDHRRVTAMGGDGTGITVPGVMISRSDGEDLVELLEGGTEVTAALHPRDITRKGLELLYPVEYAETEIEQYEYMRMTVDDSPYRNNFSASVHHPLERFADGLYVALWHFARGEEIPTTDIQLQFDFYAYEDWDWLSLSAESSTVPAGGETEFEATLAVPEDTPYGAYPGAVFVDYERGEGDAPVAGPGGYEIPVQRVVVPVNVVVGADFDYESALSFGGDEAHQADAPYDNGTVRGAFNWYWRNEAGDWRFFLFDAAEAPQGSHLVYRTTWQDENTTQADIDTRVYGPYQDGFSIPGRDEADPEWFGPYTLELLVRSAYRFIATDEGGYGYYAYHTSSGQHDDWLASRASEGLHEVMLHNVRFSGTQFAMPFETTVGALSTSESPVRLYGETCSEVAIDSQLDLPDFAVRGFGMSVPDVLEDQPIYQDDPTDRASASFRHDVVIDGEAGRFAVTLRGRAEDDLDLILLYDFDGNGEFAYETEAVGTSFGPVADEYVELAGVAPAGHYQIWVQGYMVAGGEGTFDMEIDVVTGEAVLVRDAPTDIVADETAQFEVCADTSSLEGEDGPAHGVLAFGPGGAPTLLCLDVEWMRATPAIYLPVAAQRWAIDADPLP